MNTVIFACVRNAGRSQMAAALFARAADPQLARAVSAGTDPAPHVHPVVVDVMQELGVDLSSALPRKLTTELARGASMLITMGCGERCPVVPGLCRDDWPLPDPCCQPIERAREVRDEIARRVESLVAANGWAK